MLTVEYTCSCVVVTVVLIVVISDTLNAQEEDNLCMCVGAHARGCMCAHSCYLLLITPFKVHIIKY